MSFIGSSPLGLTFDSNASGQSRSSIRSYQTVGELGIKRAAEDANLYRSVFGNSMFSPFPDQVDIGSDNSTGAVKSRKTSAQYHSSSIYDTSIPTLIDYTRKYRAMKLLASDFAYLKNVGVFPNNRLMIARRFAGPVRDDLTSYGSNGPIPLATLISWTPDGNDFISFSIGEEWEEAESSFKDVLNDIGKDMKASQDQGTGAGSLAAAAFNAIPLPGFMEGLQYKILNEMGLSEVNSVSGLPGGNPNLIREAKQRKTLKSETAGSGLKADLSVTMVVEYEQKFINGVDPTIVYYDILSNILSFGTSEASFQFSGAFGAGVSKTLQQFISGDIKGILEGIKLFVSKLITAITNSAKELIRLLVSPPTNDKQPSVDAIYNAFSELFRGTVGAVIGKYKIRIQGIANALSGAYSTPWHITIGNPQKPLFSSADMYTTDVKVTLGPILAFNDLPSSIRVEFTLKNARNLGAQEIFNKFNASGGRTYKRINMSFAETRITASTASSDYNSGNSNDLDGRINIQAQDPLDRDNLDQIQNLTKQQPNAAENRIGNSGTINTSQQNPTAPQTPQTPVGSNDSDQAAKNFAEQNLTDQ